MALRKAASSTRHPAERVTAPEVGEGAQVLAMPDRHPEPAPTAAAAPVEVPSEIEAPARVPVDRPTSGPASPAVRTTRRPARPAPAPSGSAEVAADRPQPRRKVSNRGKQNAIFRWPKADAHAVKMALRRAAPGYRAHHDAASPGEKHLLSMSPFTATALARALDHPQDWVATVRNDGRKEPIEGGVTQVGLIWDKALCDRLHEAWERLDLELSTESFALTKANLAIAGILHEVARAEEWVLGVPNDDRFSEPTEVDGRVRRPAGEGGA